jgi:two-component system sensor histidine kinase KdpD
MFGLRAVCLFDGETTLLYMEGESSTLAERTRRLYMTGLDENDVTTRTSVRCLREGGRVTGAIGFEDLPDPELTTGPLATLTAGTLARARASQAVGRAEAETKAEVFRAAILDGLAHEFKTPLTVIAAAAGGLRETGALTAQQMDLAEAIEDEAERLGKLTTRLLRKAQIEKEEIKPRLKEVDVNTLVRHVVERYATRFSNRHIRTENDSGLSLAVADEELLSLALSQLLDNAVKYTKPGSIITANILARSNGLGIRVWNSGSSVSFAERSRIFERFYRGKQSLAPGSGLGLYVARKIARAHGGTLELDSDTTTSGGVAFTLTLPTQGIEAKYADRTHQSVGCR